MKKLGITIFALLFAGLGMVNAQQRNMQMHAYFQQTILPFVQKQQAKFEKVLSTSEKATLTEIRKEMADFRKQGVQMRKAMQGNFNQQARDARKAQFDAIIAKAQKLTESHPKEAKAYKNAIETEMAKWKEHMPMMNGGNQSGQGRGQGMMGKSPQSKMQKLSDPAWGLLMDRSQMNNMMMHHPNGMRGNRQMGNMNRQRQMMMQAMSNPEMKAKVKAYAEKNIFPVIGKERTAFDNSLSKKEKKTIAEIRLQMQQQKDKMMQMRQSGKMSMNDSTRLTMRQQMDKNRVALRQIVLNHYSELQKQMAPIKAKMPQWRTDIRNIVMPNRPQQQFHQNGRKPMQPKAFLKERGDIMFLLFDPQHPENNRFMHFSQTSRRKPF